MNSSQCPGNQKTRFFSALSTLVIAAMIGCGSPALSGGTPGVLYSAGIPLPDIQLTAFEKTDNEFVPIGIGFTDSRGSFQVVSMDSTTTVALKAGTYYWTVESVGAEIVIPNSLKQPNTTQLVCQWSGDGKIELELPELKPLNIHRKN